MASVRESSDINPSDSTAEIEDRKKRLEADNEAWFHYYFAQYYTCEPAGFHKKRHGVLWGTTAGMRSGAWSRELAKSARAMMEIIKLALTRQVRNVLLISNSQDNAGRLLLPFMANMEENQRIIQDYGTQKKPGSWETGEFTCQCGCSFRAIGAGQSPRGTRNKNFRPDFILIDDIDTDEECRNPERIKAKWKWLEEALIPTMSVSGRYRVLFNGNIIAADCCITRAIEKAAELGQKGIGYADIINIRDKDGVSSWPEKELRRGYRPVPVAYQHLIGTEGIFQQSGQRREHIQEPCIREGPSFEQIQVPCHLRGPGPGESRRKQASFKSVCLLGKLKGKLYVIKARVFRGKNEDFIEAFFEQYKHVGGKASVYAYVENNKLQDPFFKQVLKKHLNRLRKKHGIPLNIIPRRGTQDRQGNPYRGQP